MARSISDPGGASGKGQLIGENYSVVQLLLRRQLGLPFFATSSGTMSNEQNEIQISRKLMLGRTGAFSEKSLSQKPVKVELKCSTQSTQAEKSGEESLKRGLWTQISSSDRTEIYIADDKLWQTKKTGSTFAEKFFVVEPLGFTCVNQFTSQQGKVKQSKVIGLRSLTRESTSTYLVTVSEFGLLRAYDLVKGKVVQEFQLTHNLTGTKLNYKSLDVDEISCKIFVYGKDKTGVKVIIILSYPPWTEMEVVHVSFPVSISVADGICFLKHPQKPTLHVTSWPVIRDAVEKLDCKSNDVHPILNDEIRIRFQGKLTKIPETLLTEQISGNSYGVLDGTWPPLYFVGFKKIIRILTLEAVPHQVYQRTDPDDMAVLPFPDGSSRALLVDEEIYEVLNFQTKYANPCVTSRSIEATNFKPFEPVQQQRPAVTTPSDSGRRPRRSCVRDVAYAEPSSVIGFTYCPGLNLIAALITPDDESFQVVFYEPLRLNVFKALPAINLWPVEKDGNRNKKRNSLKNADFHEFAVENSFIFITFQYDVSCNPKRETFMAHFMREEFIK